MWAMRIYSNLDYYYVWWRNNFSLKIKERITPHIIIIKFHVVSHMTVLSFSLESQENAPSGLCLVNQLQARFAVLDFVNYIWLKLTEFHCKYMSRDHCPVNVREKNRLQI